MSQGSFLIKNKDACFQLSDSQQKLHICLFEAFKLVFDTNCKISTEKGLYNQFAVSSKDDIQKVINFFSFSGLEPLLGSKGKQYLDWLDHLCNSTRYSNLKLPVSLTTFPNANLAL